METATLSKTYEGLNSTITGDELFSSVHVTADFYYPEYFIECPEELEQALYRASEEANNTPLKCSVYKFPGCGITGVIILAESHIAIHTWPEHDYLAIDIFTCGKRTKPEKALDYFKGIFKPKEVKINRIKRGF